MPLIRKGSIPTVNKVFVNRERPIKLFEDAAFAIPVDKAKLLVFYGIGGQGKSELCRALWRRISEDPSYHFLRAAELDLHGRQKSDPDLLLIWIRNGFAKSGVVFPCFDLAFAITWNATRREQLMPSIESSWLARCKEEIGETATDLIEALRSSIAEAATDVPVLGAVMRSVGGWVIRKGHEHYLRQTRDVLKELYRDGELKKPFELSQLLPWMLAQDLNQYLAIHPKERFALFVDEYERVFEEGSAAVQSTENPFDRHMRVLIAETNGLLATFFSRERLPWERDPDWRDDLKDAQYLLGGLTDTDADNYLRAIPIEGEGLRKAMIEGARETAEPGASVYPLMLDLQVEHWAALFKGKMSIAPEAFRASAPDFEGRRRDLVNRVLRDYGQALQATLRRLSFARRFDRPAFEHIVRTFMTGLPFDTFETIAAMSFVNRTEDGFLTIHGVVAEGIRELLDDDTKRSSLEVLFEHFADRSKVVSPKHVTDATVAAFFEATHAKRQLSVESYLDWLSSAWMPVSEAARHSDAEALWREALATAEMRLGSEHPYTALSLNNIGSQLQKQGDYAGARRLHERALAIREKVLGENHPDTARSIANLGYVHGAQGDLVRSRPLHERALSIREEVLGPKHPETARSLSSVGYVLKAQGDLAGAKTLYERALAIREEVLGQIHPDIARSLNNLGSLIQAQGDLVGAKSLYERALTIREEVLGQTHPDTARSLNNLGSLIQEQGDLVGARRLYERSLAIREETLGPMHPQTANSLNNLGHLLRKLGDLANAKSLHERALAVREDVLGPMHPETATSLTNLGHVLKAQGDLVSAKSLYERALMIRENLLGREHLNTGKSLTNLGHILKEQGDLVSAKSLYERALAIFEMHLGSEHVQTSLIREALENIGMRPAD